MNHSDDSPVPNQPAFPAVKKGLQGSPSQIDIKSGGHNIKSRYIKNIYSAKKKISSPTSNPIDYPIDEEANSSLANKNSILKTQVTDE